MKIAIAYRVRNISFLTAFLVKKKSYFNSHDPHLCPVKSLSLKMTLSFDDSSFILSLEQGTVLHQNIFMIKLGEIEEIMTENIA